jgi:hypothetical protein
MLPATSIHAGNEAPEMSQELSSVAGAPWYPVPSRAIVSIEHPFVVHDLPRAINSLGGSPALEKVRRLTYWLLSCPFLHVEASKPKESRETGCFPPSSSRKSNVKISPVGKLIVIQCSR